MAMAPVTSPALDQLVPHTGQLIGLLITCGVTAAALVATAVFCVRRRLWWPWLVVVSGTMTFLLEPLYDHLYGLWFFEQGQWTAVTTYGIHVPIWLPIIYVAYYGCGTIWYWTRLERGASMRVIMMYFAIEVFLAGLAELFYINGVGLYSYQSRQPFMIFNYPIFVAIVNGVPPTLAGIILYRLVPRLKGWEYIALLGVVPFAFAANSFGSGWLYLAARHLADPPTWLLYVTATIAVLGSISAIWIAGRLAGVGESATATAAASIRADAHAARPMAGALR
jgi:hypothetical protein